MLMEAEPQVMSALNVFVKVSLKKSKS